jgi:hypothetical protein
MRVWLLKILLFGKTNHPCGLRSWELIDHNFEVKSRFNGNQAASEWYCDDALPIHVQFYRFAGPKGKILAFSPSRHF